MDLPEGGCANYGSALSDVLEAAYISHHEGKGCVYRLPLEPSTGVFIDHPLYSYIHLFSRKCAMICDHCYRSVGSVVDNINHILQLHHTSLSSDAVELIESKQNGIRNSDYISCACCDRIYCSYRCMEDSKIIHALFCQLMTPDELMHWTSFHRYCLKTDENLYFVGLIYAQLVADVTSSTRTLEEIVLELSEFYEIASDATSLDVGDVHFLDNHVERAMPAFKLLMDVLQRFEPAIREHDPENAKRIFSPYYFLLLLSKIMLVAVEIEIENPLNKNLRLLMDDPIVRSALGQQLKDVKNTLYGHDYSSVVLDGDGWELELPDILGLGIYRSLSKLNHSCSPTLEVDYTDNNVARITLLRSVSKGEQATIAYIDEAMPLINRKNALLTNYNFVCHCQKCLEEEDSIMDVALQKPTYQC